MCIRDRYTASKQQNQQSRSFTAADLTEAETRQKIIDIDLKACLLYTSRCV